MNHPDPMEARRLKRTPEARAHRDECETTEDKLRALFEELGVEDVLDRRGSQPTPALRVVPTLDATGRVHMTLDHLVALVGISRAQLASETPLSQLLYHDSPTTPEDT